ncbi:uncharacterized protein [Nicotiana sylvestris]|uniref:uncharacterized protein n=1 Tax=Nicotiana sylvestris TaxID=4096 RepID=UPI00388CDCED
MKSRANIPQDDPNVIHLHKELHDHGQAITELTTTMNQLAKAKLQQVQGPKQVNTMEGVSMMVNKRRQKGPQVQNRVENYVQDDSGFDQDGQYNEQEEEVQYLNNFQGKRNNNRPKSTTTATTRKLEFKQSREHTVDIPEPIVPKAKAPMPRPPPPYSQRLAKTIGENQFTKFIYMMKSLSINVPLVKALEQMSGYTKSIKDLVIKKRSMNCETLKMKHQVSEIVHSMAPKLEYPDAFTIPCTIGSADFAKALCDLGASINLMPYSIFKTLAIGQPKTALMRLQMADRTIKRPLAIINDVLVRVDKFILPANIVILDREVDYEVPIILGRPFLATGKALVDVDVGDSPSGWVMKM